MRKRLQNSILFGNILPPRMANTSHFILGIISFYLLGWYSLIIPVFKESIDCYIWKGIDYKKTFTDLAGWYLGIILGINLI